ncbi:MAG: transporter substrate-binding protein, partial [Paenibacillus sp.]|nr:transporter substrate-binding protein [Paenibacillus sp.]
MKKWGMLLMAVALSLAIAACGQSKQAEGVEEPAQASGGTAAKTGGETAGKRTTYPLTVKDGSGKEFTFAKAPQRIVSLSPTETEVLFALG